MSWITSILLLTLGLPADEPKAATPSDPHRFEASVPIDARGEADLGALAGQLAESAGFTLPSPMPELRLPVRGLAGALTRTMIREALGGDVTIRAEAEMLRLTWNAAAGWRENVKGLVGLVGGEAEIVRRAYGVRPLESYRPNDPDRPTVLLLHGMNSASGSFVHMIPLFEKAGYGVVLYDFPDNQDLDVTCPRFVDDLHAFREARGEEASWSIVSHSMGGLLGRWYVEGPAYGGDIDRLIMVGPPNEGSALAKAQTLLQWIENVGMTRSGRSGSMVELSEGLGAAAEDLLPRSRFLRELNERPRCKGVHYHILAGDVGFVTQEQRREIEQQLTALKRAAGILGRLAGIATADLPAQLDCLTDGTGDGAIAVEATRLAGAPEPVVIHANHVELIRGPLLYPNPGPVACMAQVLEWLGQPASSH